MYVTGNIADAYFPSIVQFGFIFWGKCLPSANIFEKIFTKCKYCGGNLYSMQIFWEKSSQCANILGESSHSANILWEIFT
jgi:hypothetical protein